MRCVNINKCKVVSSNLQIWARSLEKLKIKLIERIVCQCWSFEGCLSLYVNKPLFYYLFFLINWLLNDCSSWNMNVFVLVVSWADLVHSLHNLVIFISSSYWLCYSIKGNLTIFKVKTSCNLYVRVKEKKKVSWNYKFCKKFGLATRVDGAGAMCSVQIIFTLLTPNIGWLVVSSSFY